MPPPPINVEDGRAGPRFWSSPRPSLASNPVRPLEHFGPGGLAFIPSALYPRFFPGTASSTRSCTCHGKHSRVPGHLDARSEVGGSLVSTCPTSLFPLPYLSPPPPFLILASLSLPHLIPSSSTFGHCRCLGLLVYATLCIISPTKRPLISVDIYPYTPVCNLSCHYPIRRPSSTFGSPVPLNAVPILCGQRQRRRRRRPPHTHAPPPGP